MEVMEQPAVKEDKKRGDYGVKGDKTSPARTAVKWPARLMAALIETKGNLSAAAMIAGVSRGTASDFLERNPEFAREAKDAWEGNLDGLEVKGFELGMSGNERMIEFFLKSRRRAIYGDKLAIDLKADVVVADASKVHEIFLRMHPELAGDEPKAIQ